MGGRLELQGLLEKLLGSKHVYFQPPASTRMVYPCIVYEWNSGDSSFADDVPYIFVKRYQITIIDLNPDSDIPDKIAGLKRCVMDRMFTSDNLNHWVFNLYF